MRSVSVWRARCLPLSQGSQGCRRQQAAASRLVVFSWEPPLLGPLTLSSGTARGNRQAVPYQGHPGNSARPAAGGGGSLDMNFLVNWGSQFAGAGPIGEDSRSNPIAFCHFTAIRLNFGGDLNVGLLKRFLTGPTLAYAKSRIHSRRIHG